MQRLLSLGSILWYQNSSIGAVRKERDATWKAREIAFLKALNKYPYRAQKDLNPEQVWGTCQWVTTHALFQIWEKSRSLELLWCL